MIGELPYCACAVSFGYGDVVTEAAAARNGSTASETVVEAIDVSRRYGEGETAVDALRGVDLKVERGELVGRHGPVGLRQVDAHAHHGRARQADVRHVAIAGTGISDLDDTQLTRLRREHIGFVFQFFNLLPMLTAEENVLLPLSLAGEKPDRAFFDDMLRTRRAQRPPLAPPVRALGRPAAARRDRSRSRQPPDRHLRRRADRQPRLEDRRRDPRPDARVGRRVRPDDGDGHARGARRRDRRPHPLPRRRADREGARRASSRTRSSRRWIDHRGVTKFALKGLLGRKLRTALTAIAIVLGVAMVSGTFVLTDSIDKAFDTIFTDVRQGSNAVISGKSAFDLSRGQGSFAPTLDESLLAGGPRAAGRRRGRGQRRRRGPADRQGRQGDRLRRRAEPRLLASRTATRRSTRWRSSRARGRGADEVVVDESTADQEDLKLGQTIGVQAEGPVQELRISGIVRFGSVSTIGGATLAGFDLPTAQELFGKRGQARRDRRRRQARDDATEQLIQEIEPVLPPTAQVKSASQQATDDAEETNSFISFLRGFLLAFGGIALFVGSFVIANSLSITIAQRTREFATLRTIGGSRRQVLMSIVIEALVVGAARVGRRARPRPPPRPRPLLALRRRRIHAAERGASCSRRERSSCRCSSGSS